MTIEFAEKARDRSTYPIKLEFFDYDNAPVVPNSITWKLTDDVGAVINSRTAETETPDSTVYVVLSDDDIAYSDGEKRVLLVQSPFDSDLGAGLPLNEEYRFDVDDLINIT